MHEGIDQLDFSGGFGALWQLIKDANAYIEDRQPWVLHKAGDAATTAAVLGDCLEALRIVALLASPVIPNAAAELWRRLGLPGAPEEQRLPDAAVWGSAATAGNTLEKGDVALPPHRQSVTPERPGSTATATCRPTRPRRTRCSIGPGPAGVDWLVCVGTDLETSRAALALAERHDDVHATVGLHPHDASRLGAEWPELVELARDPPDRRDRRGRLRPPLPALAARGAGGRVPRSDPARARHRPGARHPLA